ncbi:hypothetical protein ANTRET_LOCUS1288 [Anthophora retusa]
MAMGRAEGVAVCSDAGRTAESGTPCSKSLYVFHWFVQHTPNKILSARKRPAPRVQAVLVVIGDAIWPSVSVYEIKEW